LGLSIIAAIDFASLASSMGVWLQVAFWLGMVIFVHELGHFAVAKWCGVKCEKFYLGFDIYGLKLLHFRWGETEYGIGILPLGGYVKMLGQDDNPAHAAQERERSRLEVPEAAEKSDHVATASASDGETIVLDPRSYMAKSVPQRMAIISAGVIMNVIFAFAAATWAYSLGVTETACGISAVLPGEAAWKANLQPGDMIVGIDNSGDRPLKFRDLRIAVALGDLERGIDFRIQREGVAEPFVVNVKPDPDKKRLRPTIGVIPPRTTSLLKQMPVAPGTPAAQGEQFKGGDRITAVDGQSVATYADLAALWNKLQDKSVKVTIERKKAVDDKTNAAEDAATETLEFEVAPRPTRTLGLVMKMGKITAVQPDSPAAKEDLRAGDAITAIDGQPIEDPMRLPDLLRRKAGETITLSITREAHAGQDEKLEKRVALRDWPWWEDSVDMGMSVSAPALGITYKVLNIVHQTIKDSPAADAELLEGDKPAATARLAPEDEIVEALFILPPKQEGDDTPAPPETSRKLKFSATEPNWPYFMYVVQHSPAGTKVKLTLKDGRTTTIGFADAPDWYLPDRGFNEAEELVKVKASSLGEAISLAGLETRDAVLQVYLFLRKIGSQISVFSLGGPASIVKAAGGAAFDGFPQLLVFLTLLSANLAVVNFLPIPLLDGGHMVFLILEGILRRPVSEKIVVAFHYLGFLFIVSLMLFVLGLDFGVIPRQ